MSPWQDVQAPGVGEVGEISQAEMAVKGSNLISTDVPIMCTYGLEMTFIEKEGTIIAQGTEFLVNLPGHYKKDPDLIMMAGHNLVSKYGTYADKVTIYFHGAPPVTVYWRNGDYFASKSYERMPNAASVVNDYGAIMIRKGDVEFVQDITSVASVMAYLFPSKN